MSVLRRGSAWGSAEREDKDLPPFLDLPCRAGPPQARSLEGKTRISRVLLSSLVALPRAPLPRRHEARRDVGGDHGSDAAASGAFTAPGEDAALALLSADLLDRPT